MNRWLSLTLVLILGWLLGMLGFSLWDKMPTPTSPVVWPSEAQWIGPVEPNYRFYARRSFEITDEKAAGWLKLSADNDFILYVNNFIIASEFSYQGGNPRNTTMGLANKLTETNQKFNDTIFYNHIVGDNIQKSPTEDWKLTVYVDLTPYLKLGKNVIGLEVEKNRKNPKVIVNGAISSRANTIDLTTGATVWRVSNLAQNRQQLRWFDPEFFAENWPKAKLLGHPIEKTYTQMSQHLFDLPLQGKSIGGVESEKGEVWLKNTWEINKFLPRHGERAFIRFAGDGEYSLLINGMLVNHYGADDVNKLHLYEITNLLHRGKNEVKVRLAHPLGDEIIKQNINPLGWYLDGWVETNQGEIKEIFATDKHWQSVTNVTKNVTKLGEITPPNPPLVRGGIGEITPPNPSLSPPEHPPLVRGGNNEAQQTVTILRKPSLSDFKRQVEGNAYLLNYPDYVLRQGIWCLGGMAIALFYAWILGRWWLNIRENWWLSLGGGAGLLFPGTLFLIIVGLLKHRYGQSEAGLLFALPASNPLIMLSFVIIVLLTLIFSKFSKKSRKLTNSPLIPPNPPSEGGLKGCFSVFLMGGWGGLNSEASSNSPLSKGGWGGSNRDGSTIPLLSLWLASGIVLSLIWAKVGNLLLIGVIVTGVAIISLLEKRPKLIQVYLKIAQNKRTTWVMLFLIVSIAFMLRIYKLGFMDLEPDENVSYDAVRGILSTWGPVSTSGIIYSRGPVFHYSLALWMLIFGKSAVIGRLYSTIWGTATLVVVFFFTRKLTGKAWIALLVIAILAIHPWELWYSRNLRFYALTQFLYFLSFVGFWEGFIIGRKRNYQYTYFICLTLALLTQEVTMTLIPGLIIGAFYFYRPFPLSKDWKIIFADWPLIFASIITIILFGFDGTYVKAVSLTPLAGLSSATDSFLKFVLGNLTFFAIDCFVSYERYNVIYSFFFFAGLIYFLCQQNSRKFYLYGHIIAHLVFVTLIVVLKASRYYYSFFPLFILLSVYSACYLAEKLGSHMEKMVKNSLPLKNITIAMVLCLLLFNIEPGRVISSYQDTIISQHVTVGEYIKEHRQPGDVVISNIPSVLSNVLGGRDYFVPHRTSFFDAAYWHNGYLVDRWEGGKVLFNADQLSNLLAKSNRVWIHLNHKAQLPKDAQLAEFEDTLETLGKPIMEPFGTTLRLWTPEDGVLPRVPNTGKDLGAY